MNHCLTLNSDKLSECHVFHAHSRIYLHHKWPLTRTNLTNHNEFPNEINWQLELKNFVKIKEIHSPIHTHTHTHSSIL